MVKKKIENEIFKTSKASLTFPKTSYFLVVI